MVISIDRNSGLFNPEMSDRINTKSTDLYENIQALNVPDKAFKERVYSFKISSKYKIDQRCYIIGRTCILQFQVNEKVSGNGFLEFGTIPYSPNIDMLWFSDGGIFQIRAGTNIIKLYPFSDTTPGYWVYNFFNM